MRTLILAAAMTVLAGWTPSLAQSAGDKASDEAARQPTATELSGLTVTARKPPSVSELTVTLPACPQARTSDSPPPKVVSSFPENGAVVRPGILVVRVTFDKPMTCVGMLDNDWPLPNPCPAPLRSPLISRDRRTFMTVCVVDQIRRYGVLLARFTSLGGTQLKPYELAFQTSDMPQVTTVQDALAEDRWLRQASYTAP